MSTIAIDAPAPAVPATRHAGLAAATGPAAPAGFEYAAVRVPESAAELHRDTARAFGWEIVEETATGRRSRTLRLKRDRALGGSELRLLERSATAALGRIASLERSRSILTAVTGWTIGMIGTAMLAFSVLTMRDEATLLAYLVGIGGIVEWAIAPLLARFVRRMATKRNAPEIDRQYELLYAATADARAILR